MVRLGRPITALDPASIYFSVLSVIVAAIWLALLAAYRTRSPRIVGAGVEEYRRVMSATLATIGVVAVALMIFRPEYARGYLAVALPARAGRPGRGPQPLPGLSGQAAPPRTLRRHGARRR